jgi:hypothetical protein
LILPNGHFVRIRDKYVRQPDANLVLVIEVWRSEADYKANPTQPRAAHDWLHLVSSEIQAAGGYDKSRDGVHKVDPNKDLMSGLIATLQCILDEQGNGTVAVRSHPRRVDDAFAWLSHPHIAALEVRP